MKRYNISRVQRLRRRQRAQRRHVAGVVVGVDQVA